METSTNERVIRLEERVNAIEDDIGEMKAQLLQTAKKEDMAELRDFLEERDGLYTRNLWKLVFALVGVVGLIALAFVGVKEIPGLF